MDEIKERIQTERGQSNVEYALIMVLVVILAISVLSLLGPAIGEIFSKVTIALQNPQNYTEVLATRDAEIAATQDAQPAATQEIQVTATRKVEIAATQEAEIADSRDAIIISNVSVRREGEASLRVYASVSEPSMLTTVTSDGRSASARCVESCVIRISGVDNSSGVVRVTASTGSSVSARYPAKIVSDLWKPESVATITGTVSSLALAVFLGKNLWWRVGLKVASQYAASGKVDVAFKIFQRVTTGGKASSAKASGAWNFINESLVKSTQPWKLLDFFDAEQSLVEYLSSMHQLEYYTELGKLSSTLGTFDEALSAFQSAEPFLDIAGRENVSSVIRSTLFSGMGAAYVRAKGDDITSLKQGGQHFNDAQESVIEIDDEEVRAEIEKKICDGRKRLSRALPTVRRKQRAWGTAEIDRYEDDHSLYVDSTYTLTASMGWGDVPTEAKKDKSTQFNLPESLESFEFDISVWAEDMDVEPMWIRTLELDPAADWPIRIQFELAPRVIGTKTVKIDFYYRLHWLDQIVFQVEVMESPVVILDTTDEDLVSVQPVRVGMLLGFGGLGDKSFNDSAYEGLESARQLYNIEFETANSTPEENEGLLQQWAKADYDLIIAIGYHNGPAIAQVAESFPEKRFAIIDTEVENVNVWSAVFREYETDYVVGALAAIIAGPEGRIGFIGGVETPVISRIESAFSRGIESVNPDITLEIIYVNRFDDEIMGQGIAEMIYAAGTNVIYQAAGGSGIGAIQAAKKLGRLIVSTGGDHSALAPDAVITSRIKNVHRPVFDIVEAVVKDQFEGGKTASYGLDNKGVSLAPIRPEVVERLAEHLPSDMSLHDLITRMAQITENVTSGQIVVDFAQVEETPESPDDQQFDAELSDVKSADDESSGDKSASGEASDDELLDEELTEAVDDQHAMKESA